MARYLDECDCCYDMSEWSEWMRTKTELWESGAAKIVVHGGRRDPAPNPGENAWPISGTCSKCGKSVYT